MYTPAHFAVDDPASLHALMRDRPLATLVTHCTDGLDANPVPLLWVDDGSPNGLLRGHVAKANPLWREADGAAVLAVFHGPQAYVSPGWYPTKQETGKVVPTWNYAVVQARGTLRAVTDTAWLRDLVDSLTRSHEASQPAPWSVNDAPPVYLDAMLNGIVGIEIAITSLRGKWKMSQNQPEANRRGVVAGLQERGEAAVAAAVAKQLAD